MTTQGVAGSSPAPAHRGALITGHAPSHWTREIVENRRISATTAATVVSTMAGKRANGEGTLLPGVPLTVGGLGSIHFGHDASRQARSASM